MKSPLFLLGKQRIIPATPSRLEEPPASGRFRLRKEARAVTDKQKRFCDEYLIDANATRAYKVAYPNIKSDEAASVCASKLLRNAKVKNYIDEQLEKVSSSKVASAEEVLEFLTSVMRNDAESVKNRIKAGELMGKRHGLFKDTLNVQGAVPIVIDGGESLED